MDSREQRPFEIARRTENKEELLSIGQSVVVITGLSALTWAVVITTVMAIRAAFI
jgi:hypothetical protein